MSGRPAVSQTDAELLLGEWGKWVRSGRIIPQYTSPMLALIRDNVGSTLPSAMIDDHTAVLVDTLVAKLGNRNQRLADALIYYFPGGMNYIQIGKRWGVSRELAGNTVREAISWIDGALAGGE